MVEYADATHRPFAIHTGEEPTTEIARGPAALRVTLDNWPLHEVNAFPSMYDALQSNWGESPCRTVDRDCMFEGTTRQLHEHINGWEHDYGWCKLHPDERRYVESCFAGKTLQQVLERFTFSFCVDGCTRAETHQIVRTRVGAGFMQHGGRDNDWRHRAWTMTETIARACDADKAKRDASRMPDGLGGTYPTIVNDREVCIRNWEPIEQFIHWQSEADNLRGAIAAYLEEGKKLYSALVDAGIPWQDARRVLWMGTQTYIHCDYNYVALKGVLANRLEHIMDWEVNCVAQLMQREVNMKCPPIFGKYLGSHSDRQKKAAFAGLESWPPDGKWPTTPEQDALPRQHSPQQMPFWVLSPASMAGGPVEWIWTNGRYPEELHNTVR